MNPPLPPPSSFRHRTSAAALCALLLLAPSSHAQKKSDPVSSANAKALALLGKPAPDFTLPDPKASQFHLADSRGNVVVLAFWATWCPPCRAEMPMFKKLQTEMASQGVSVVLIANDDPAKASAYLTRSKLDLWSLTDGDRAVSTLYGANALPKTFVLDRNGTVAKVILGKASEHELRTTIAAALQPGN
ncbi:MAG: TlpA disulfide reductase family protein [Acidobacteriaceae bacterium]|jgi:peroxiredoxin